MAEDIQMKDLSQGPIDTSMLSGPSSSKSVKNKLGTRLAYKRFLEEFRRTVPEKPESEQMFEAAAKWSSMSLEERRKLCYPENQLQCEAKTEGPAEAEEL